MYSILLLESGDHFLLEAGFRLLLEDSDGNPPDGLSGNFRAPLFIPDDSITDEEVFAILALVGARRR